MYFVGAENRSNSRPWCGRRKHKSASPAMSFRSRTIWLTEISLENHVFDVFGPFKNILLSCFRYIFNLEKMESGKYFQVIIFVSPRRDLSLVRRKTTIPSNIKAEAEFPGVNGKSKIRNWVFLNINFSCTVVLNSANRCWTRFYSGTRLFRISNNPAFRHANKLQFIS